MEFLHLDTDHPELHGWIRNVGLPVALDLAPPLADVPAELDVLCWNLAIGGGRLNELLEVLSRPEHGAMGLDPARPLVVLAQEAYRADQSVPQEVVGRYHGGKGAGPEPGDIVDLAYARDFSLRYAPSMRNGVTRSDRGNAILSNVALADARAFHLPHVRQRRVAVGARLEGVDDILFVSAHLDTGGQPYGRTRLGRFGGGRVFQAAGLAHRLAQLHDDGTFILGADLNTYLGQRDPAFLALRAAGFVQVDRDQPFAFTFRGNLRLLLDHILVKPGRRPVSAAVWRIDDPGSPSGRRVFGSDHHPLLARIRLLPESA